MSSFSREFVELIYGFYQAKFPEKVLHQARRCLLDYLGVTLAGSKIYHKQLNSILEFTPQVPNGVFAIGLKHRTSLETAALVNGIASHAAELDDGSRFGMIHPGGPIISALLPVAQHNLVDFHSLLRGIVIGYEVALRIAAAVQPSHYQRGFHPTATCGSIGAAAAIAAMLDFSLDELEASISIAAITCGGTLKVVDSGSLIKPFNVGQAAVSGITAAYTSKAGFVAPPGSLEGPTGFFAMMSNSCDLSILLEAGNESHRIMTIYVKPYAACRHAHPAIEASLVFKGKQMTPIDKIQSIQVNTYGGLKGRHDNQVALDPASAKMSIPVSVAVALVQGSAGLMDFEEQVISKTLIQNIASKVSVVTDPVFDSLLPEQRAARVDFVDVYGHHNSIYIDIAKGEPENPLSDDELESKFANLAVAAGKTLNECQAAIAALRIGAPKSLMTLMEFCY